MEIEKRQLFFSESAKFQTMGRGTRRGEGEAPHETEKIVVEKWCYFPELYKMTKVREDGIENG